MIRNTAKLRKTEYDLLVIGGGINGAAISHLAAQRGMKVALLEKGDFASGTSGKSTKLIHGGIRYLENLEFDLVYESLQERYLQLKAAPHLVKPLGIVIPVYQHDRRPLWMMKLGVFLYDVLAGKYKIKRRRNLSAAEILELEPGIRREGLVGGVMYYDAQMDDFRLCLENVLMACQYGADAANYVEVLSFLKENGRSVGVTARDLLTGENFQVRAKRIVCAVGPWTNQVLRLDQSRARKQVRTTKGIHIVYPGQISKHALLITSQSDGRIFFVIPWFGNSLIGTTDTNSFCSPDFVTATPQDVDYLFREARRIFPDMEFSKEKIITTFAGLRPLVRKPGSPSKLSRKHLFYETVSGILFVMGGKYTTYRKIAEDCMHKLEKGYPDQKFILYGGGAVEEAPEAVAGRFRLEEDIVRNLMEKYGKHYMDLLKLIEEDSKLKEKVCDAPPVIMAQLVYSVRVEMARNAGDIARRLLLDYYPPVPEKFRKAVAKVFEEEEAKNEKTNQKGR